MQGRTTPAHAAGGAELGAEAPPLIYDPLGVPGKGGSSQVYLWAGKCVVFLTPQDVSNYFKRNTKSLDVF